MLLITLLGNNCKHSDPNNKWGYYNSVSLCKLYIATKFLPSHNNKTININIIIILLLILLHIIEINNLLKS